MALRYKDLKDFHNAIAAYFKCLEIERNHWCYYELWLCLDELKEFEKALQIIIEGHRQHPTNSNYYFALGVAYSRLEKYDDAIEFYKIYLKHHPNEITTQQNLKIAILENAKLCFSQNKFKNCVQNFEQLISLNEKLSFYDEIMLFKAILKLNNPNFILNEENEHYVKLNSLHKSYKKKIKEKQKISEIEKNISNFREYSLDARINFGKFLNCTVQEILNLEPQYLLWCVTNLIHFSIDPKIFFEKEIKNKNNYLQALEINLIKIELLDLWEKEEDIEDMMHDRYLHEQDPYPSYGEWLRDEFGDDAETAYWNLD